MWCGCDGSMGWIRSVGVGLFGMRLGVSGGGGIV